MLYARPTRDIPGNPKGDEAPRIIVRRTRDVSFDCNVSSDGLKERQMRQEAASNSGTKTRTKENEVKMNKNQQNRKVTKNNGGGSREDRDRLDFKAARDVRLKKNVERDSDSNSVVSMCSSRNRNRERSVSPSDSESPDSDVYGHDDCRGDVSGAEERRDSDDAFGCGGANSVILSQLNFDSYLVVEEECSGLEKYWKKSEKAENVVMTKCEWVIINDGPLNENDLSDGSVIGKLIGMNRTGFMYCIDSLPLTMYSEHYEATVNGNACRAVVCFFSFRVHIPVDTNRRLS